MNIGSGGSVAFTGAVATVAPAAVEDAPAAAEKKVYMSQYHFCCTITPSISPYLVLLLKF